MTPPDSAADPPSPRQDVASGDRDAGRSVFVVAALPSRPE
jgi:hypothetical protein